MFAIDIETGNVAEKSAFIFEWFKVLYSQKRPLEHSLLQWDNLISQQSQEEPYNLRVPSDFPALDFLCSRQSGHCIRPIEFLTSWHGTLAGICQNSQIPYFCKWFPPLNSFRACMYCDQRWQYIRLNSKKNSFRGNYSRKYGIYFI